MTEKYKNFINNKWVDPVTEKYFESTSPANNDEILGLFASSDAQDANIAINSAYDGFQAWKKHLKLHEVNIFIRLHLG